jgi:GT2 family glycosyltransferase
MDISIIIVNWNTKDLLLSCVSSVFETVTNLVFELWVVDNGSTDGSVDALLDKYPEIYIIRNHQNLGFAAANNLALKRMNGRYALLLNTDTILTRGAANKLYELMEGQPDAGIACGQLLHPDGSKQDSIANFPSILSLLSNETVMRVLFPGKFPSKMKSYNAPIAIDSGIGACLMVRKKAMDDVGFLDERYFFFFEETDWALTMKQHGWKTYFIPDAYIIHAQGKTIGNNVTSRITFYRSRYLYFKKWYPRSYPYVQAFIYLRLWLNTLLTFIGILLTMGMKRDLNKKIIIYLQLIVWHLKGCP